MKTIKVGMIIFILLSVILFVGCTEENKDENSLESKKLVGIWKSGDDNAAYVFYSEGTFTFDSTDDGRYEGSYEIKNNLLSFRYTYPSDFEGEIELFNYELSSDGTVFTISPYEHPEYSAVFYKK